MDELLETPLNDDTLGILLSELDEEIANDEAESNDETRLVEDNNAATEDEEKFEVMVVPFNTEDAPVDAAYLISQYSVVWIPIVILLLMHVIMRIPIMKEKNWKL